MNERCITKECLNDTGFSYTLSLINGKYKMTILYTLMEFGVVRFNEMKKYIGEISFKTLSSNLKELEADQLVHREEYPQIPPKVEYSLTERGKSLIPILDQMCEWGEKNRIHMNRKEGSIMKRNVYFLSSILTLTLATVILTCHPVTASTTTLKLNKTKLTVKVGRKKSLKIKGSDKKLKWKTSNARVAAISSSGIVTGIKKGTATITATAGKQHAKCKITIKYGKTYYKRSFGATLVPVQVYEGGKQVAGAHFFVKDGDLGCNIGQYGHHY